MSVRPTHIEYELSDPRKKGYAINVLRSMAANAAELNPFTLAYRAFLPCAHEHVPCEALDARRVFVNKKTDYVISPHGDMLTSAFLQVDVPPLPFSKNGYFPLYYSSVDAEDASPAHTSHVHVIGGQTYYMPDGVTMYHGSYTGADPFYAHGLGELLIERAELTLGRKVVQTLRGEYDFAAAKDMHRAHAGIKTEESDHRYSKATVDDLRRLSTTRRTLNIDLPFFFSKTPLPIQKILTKCGAEARIRVYFRDASKYVFGPADPSVHAIPKTNKALFVGSATLDDREAQRVMDADFRVLVREAVPQHVHEAEGDSFEGDTYEVRLRTSRPVTQLVFFGRNSDKTSVVSSSQRRIGAKRLMSSKLVYSSNDVQQTGRELVIPDFVTPLDIMRFDTTFSDVQFDLEHHHRFPTPYVPGSYFRHVQNQFLNRIPRAGVHNYSFSLAPSTSPTVNAGQLNLGKVDDKVFRCKPGSSSARIFLYAETLNIFYASESSHGMMFIG
jgi:hypothetical protein